jgi:hypothetical protein
MKQRLGIFAFWFLFTSLLLGGLVKSGWTTNAASMQACPTVSGISPSSGAVGSLVLITGSNFTGVTTVKFGGNVTAVNPTITDTQITGTVPNGATIGVITISKTSCSDVTTSSFTVTQVASCPTMSGLSPSSSAVGTTVTINGANFAPTGFVSVKFANSVSSPIITNTGVALTVNVPSGAVTGPITISQIGCNDVTPGTFTVGSGCSFALNPTTQNFAATGGSGSVTVTTTAGCAWMASSNAAWITLGNFSGTGSGSVGFLVAANTGVQRTGTVSIAGQPFSVTQDAFGCSTITLSPATLPNGFTGTAYSQTVTSSGGSGTYSYAISAGALPGGLTLSAGGLLAGAPVLVGTFNFTITATDANNCTGTRSYTVVISGAGLQFYPLPQPVRLLETRAGLTGCIAPAAPITGGTSLTVAARGTCAGATIPPEAAAVTGNITTVNSGGGYLTVYPNSASLLLVANSNYSTNEVVNNVFTVGLGSSDGAFKLYALNTTDVVVDITGYYAPTATSGLYFHILPTPVRLLETRAGLSGCFAPGIPLPANQDFVQLGATTCDGVTIPSTAQALVGNATTVNPQAVGYLTFFPANGSRPLAAGANYVADRRLIHRSPWASQQRASSRFTPSLKPIWSLMCWAITAPKRPMRTGRACCSPRSTRPCACSKHGRVSAAALHRVRR